ncbi:hypothetical protein D0N50_07475 [Erwinia billingiae]|uniref:WavE lipopolysaccharide synthesis family protein n=1 Tax=Erwinia billingiae TaxID=182337 RepID=UPI0012481A95|nr:WavE lipopolysaccharide synthesis family protein [Erwinia billingiae]QEW31531.1 hypothetical protein D0N50_07475 [Erwinia billingiae]
MDKLITVIIHGPLEEDFLVRNIKSVKKHIATADIVISGYRKDQDDIEKALSGISLLNDSKVKIVLSDDVFNPGFFNINRQINLVNAGLNAVDNHDSYILKVRMDQLIEYKKLISLLNKFEEQMLGKLVTTNCYTRKDRLYHPSDMFLAGSYETLRLYYPKTLFTETHLDNVLLIKELVKNNHEEGFHDYWPESRLFMNFLGAKGVTLNFTESDSRNHLQQHTFVLNSWDIGLRWKKFLKGYVTVLPYNFTMAPFFGGPVEIASNYVASDININASPVKEKVIKAISRGYFSSGLYVANPIFFNYRLFALKVLRKVFDISLKFIPPIFHNALVSAGRKLYYAIK